MAKPKSAKEKSRIEPSTMGVRHGILIHSLLVAVHILSDLVIEGGIMSAFKQQPGDSLAIKAVFGMGE